MCLFRPVWKAYSSSSYSPIISTRMMNCILLSVLFSFAYLLASLSVSMLQSKDTINSYFSSSHLLKINLRALQRSITLSLGSDRAWTRGLHVEIMLSFGGILKEWEGVYLLTNLSRLWRTTQILIFSLRFVFLKIRHGLGNYANYLYHHYFNVGVICAINYPMFQIYLGTLNLFLTF